MRPISDAFLLSISEISATLVGLFVVGVFFYADSGFRQLHGRVRAVVEPYVRAGTTIVLVLFAVPLLLPLALVALEPPWATGLFAVLSVLLVVTNIGTVRRIRRVTSATRSRLYLINELISTIAVVAIVVLPWLLGGLSPSREDLTWSILLAFGTGFLSVATLLLSVFGTSR